jgi:hypothetical protein
MGTGSFNYARFNAINSKGQVVGTSNQTPDARSTPFGRQRAAVWGVNGTPQKGGWQGLLAPAPNGTYAGFPEDYMDISDAVGMNNAGVVVGYLTFKEGIDNRPRGAVWLYRDAKWAVYMDLGNYADANNRALRDSTFNGVSDSGLIVGWARDGGFYDKAQKKPWSWTTVGSGVSGKELTCSSGGGAANAVNNAGIIVGNSYDYTASVPPSITRINAVYWSSTTASCVPFPTLGGTYSNVTAIQAGGQAVGSANTPSGQKHAVLYYATGGKYITLDLNVQFGAEAITALGFSYLEEATGINSSGNIVGYGMLPNGKRAAFKLMGVFGATVAANMNAVSMSELSNPQARSLVLGEASIEQSISSSQTIEIYNTSAVLELSPAPSKHKH